MQSQTLASQQCLAMPELVGEILHQVAPGARDFEFISGEATATLAILARTAKLFHEEALTILWQSIRGLKPFLALLPGGVWEPEKAAPIDLHRCFEYTCRVKRLNITSTKEWKTLDRKEVKPYDSDKIAERIFSKLPANQSCLFPELVDVRLPVDFFGAGAFRGRLFLGNKVTKLEIYPEESCSIEVGDRSMLWWDNMLNLVRPMAKNLIKLNLKLIMKYKPVDELLSLYRQSPKLQHLHSLPILINKKTFDHLSRLPGLKHVAFPFENAPIFSSLRFAHFEIDQIGPLLRLLKTWAANNLTELHVDRSQWIDTWDLDTFFEALSLTQNRLTLKRISVHERLEDRVDPDLESIKLSHAGFRRLLVFRNVTHFSISTHVPDFINDGFLEEIATAWPQLHAFQFKDNTIRWTSDVSINGMIKFISACEKLDTFSLSINFTSLNDADLDITKLPSFQKITSLGVRMSVPPSSATRMVAFLHHVFPKISFHKFKYHVRDTVLYRDLEVDADEEYAAMLTIWKDVAEILRQEHGMASIAKMSREELELWGPIINSMAVFFGRQGAQTGGQSAGVEEFSDDDQEIDQSGEDEDEEDDDDDEYEDEEEGGEDDEDGFEDEENEDNETESEGEGDY
ncbi:hypothetical protein NP233_g11022 [Leucocoprinus birnbaumii]|uniref:F-box domain-containing protein n=1 Tax=Leucocoprinus birnbaumii TaxID=56174 RepID=A0AAD5YRC0_9AGAR|nr:hypothetical protein NP233_g11022 [Leucocoprinus birnbaumii]